MPNPTVPSAQPSTQLILYRFSLSGHAHRAELMLSLLGLPYRLVDVDLRGGEHKREAFLRLNPFGQVPVLDDGGTIVSDSNAILVYLAARYDDGNWLPRDPAGAAAVQRWLSVAAGEIASGPAAARLAVLFGATLPVEEARARASRLFALMEPILAHQPFLAASHATLADVAAYSYIARAEEGGVALSPYPALNAWLRRIEALPGFIPMPVSRVGLAA